MTGNDLQTYTVAQVSQLTGLTERAVRRAIEAGDLRAISTSPRGTRIAEGALRAWLGLETAR